MQSLHASFTHAYCILASKDPQRSTFVVSSSVSLIQNGDLWRFSVLIGLFSIPATCVVDLTLKVKIVLSLVVCSLVLSFFFSYFLRVFLRFVDAGSIPGRKGLSNVLDVTRFSLLSSFVATVFPPPKTFRVSGDWLQFPPQYPVSANLKRTRPSNFSS